MSTMTPRQNELSPTRAEPGDVADPDRASGAVNHPVLAGDPAIGLSRDLLLAAFVLEHRLELVGVDALAPQARSREPFVRRVAERVLDLGADVEEASVRAGLRLVHDRRQPLDQLAKPRLDPGELGLRLDSIGRLARDDRDQQVALGAANQAGGGVRPDAATVPAGEPHHHPLLVALLRADQLGQAPARLGAIHRVDQVDRRGADELGGIVAMERADGVGDEDDGAVRLGQGQHLGDPVDEQPVRIGCGRRCGVARFQLRPSRHRGALRSRQTRATSLDWFPRRSAGRSRLTR